MERHNLNFVAEHAKPQSLNANLSQAFIQKHTYPIKETDSDDEMDLLNRSRDQASAQFLDNLGKLYDRRVVSVCSLLESLEQQKAKVKGQDRHLKDLQVQLRQNRQQAESEVRLKKQ